MDGPHQGLKTFTVQKVDGPNKGRTYITPKKKKRMDPTDVQNPKTHKERTKPVHKLYKSTKWTAIRGHDHIPRNEQTLPESQIL